MPLTLRLLGPPRVHPDRQPVTGLVSNKVRALFFLLAADTECAHRRESLAGLLWPDYPERSARTNLSNALSHLRTALADRDLDTPFLLVSGETVQLNPQAGCAVDRYAFGNGSPARSGRRATDAYTGPFLEGFSLPDSPAFEQWVLTTRIVTTGLSGNIAQVWDAATGEELLVLTGHQNPVCGADWSPDGTRIATTGWDGTVKFWDAARGFAHGQSPAPERPGDRMAKSYGSCTWPRTSPNEAWQEDSRL